MIMGQRAFLSVMLYVQVLTSKESATIYRFFSGKKNRRHQLCT